MSGTGTGVAAWLRSRWVIVPGGMVIVTLAWRA